jgi:hypothetical protein
MEPPSNKAAKWLSDLSKRKEKFISLFPEDFLDLKIIIPIGPVRTFKNANNQISIFQIDRQRAIQMLVSLYRFKTKPEAAKEIRERHGLNRNL